MVSRSEFNAMLRADIVTTPKNVVGIGWVDPKTGWVVTADQLAITRWERVGPVVRHLDHALEPKAGTPPFWLFCCMYDGWRERMEVAATYTSVDVPAGGLDDQVEWVGPPGSTPRMSPHRDWVACFSAHRDDPTALLLPEAHYLVRHYRPLRFRTAVARRPWRLRKDRASYAGGAHSVTSPHTAGPQLRRDLEQLVKRGQFPIDVSIGGRVTRREQLRNKYVIDIDGAVRTWDAWAWKMFSGSAVLSPASTWETWFTRSFEPWVHFVPVAGDLSDLGEQLEWCRAHDDECRQMAARARHRALEVYDRRLVERESAAVLRAKLGLEPVS